MKRVLLMDMVHLGQVAVLGVVEGITEFLPVSSTGHLIIMDEVLGFKGPSGMVFEVVIQLGAILAVCWVYRQKFTEVLLGLTSDRNAQNFTRNVLLAFLPSMVIGFFAYKTIKELLMTPLIVCWALVLGGIAILAIERVVKNQRYSIVEEFPALLSLKIGFFQCISMIPGVSRSGATIMGALLMGVERKAAAEFSFFLAVPTMVAASAYDLFKHRNELSGDDIDTIALGFVLAFISALFVVRQFIGFVGRHGFAPFAWYRILLGTAGLAVLYLR
jgi:undecaprenyl-diphosphatase